jgi:hypothetical protein
VYPGVNASVHADPWSSGEYPFREIAAFVGYSYHALIGGIVPGQQRRRLLAADFVLDLGVFRDRIAGILSS